MTIRYATAISPVGRLLFVGDGEVLHHLHIEDPDEAPRVSSEWRQDQSSFKRAREQMEAYFEGQLLTFELELNPRGTEFQRRVWDALKAIPFGETASYIDIAARVGSPRASRAVGSANARNPIAIVVPCHRVINASGSLGGYAGGLDRKRHLLSHEARFSRKPQSSHL